MFEKYKKYVGAKVPPNHFWSVTEDKIAEAEHRIGFPFPSELRTFFLEVGYGFYAKGEMDLRKAHVNRVVSPSSIASMMCDPKNIERPSRGFPSGHVPFFDTGEAEYFILKSSSPNPNAVYDSYGVRVISKSLQEFFDKLFDHASFYIGQ